MKPSCFYCKKPLRILKIVEIEKEPKETKFYHLEYCQFCGTIYQVVYIMIFDEENHWIRTDVNVKEVGKLNLEFLDYYP